MGSRWLKIQDRSFCVEFKNTELKKCGAELLIMWSAGDERQSWWCRVTVHRLVGLFDGPFSGNPTLIGPWGCPMALPCRWGMTDSSNEACHRGKGPLKRRLRTSMGPCDIQRVLISQQWWGGWKKEDPFGRQPALSCLWILVRLPCVSSQCWRHTEETWGVGGGCGEFFISKEREKMEKGAHSPMRSDAGCCHVNVSVPVYNYRTKFWWCT